MWESTALTPGGERFMRGEIAVEDAVEAGRFAAVFALDGGSETAH